VRYDIYMSLDGKGLITVIYMTLMGTIPLLDLE
jgi:hypothetical protein